MRCLMCKSFIRSLRKTRCKRCGAMNIRHVSKANIPKTANSTTLVFGAVPWSPTVDATTGGGEFHYAYRF